jgi:hypothetical protein
MQQQENNIMKMDKDQEEEILIEKSNKKIVPLVLVALFFVLISIELWNESSIQDRFSPSIIKLISLLVFFFFGGSVVFGLYQIFNKAPGLIINRIGIRNCVNNDDFVKWDNILKIEVIKIRNTSILLIFVKNTDEIIAKANPWKKYWLNLSMKWYGTPISLSSNLLKCSVADLKEVIAKEFEKNKRQTKNEV